MKVVLGGVRGSWSIAGPQTVVYGGNTLSILVEGAGARRVLLDFGSGVAALNARLTRDDIRELDCFLTHFHLDHIIGLPALSLLYRMGAHVRIAAPVFEDRRARDLLARLMDPPLWSVPLSQVPANLTFENLDPGVGGPVACGELKVRWLPLPHPEGCMAYRVDDSSAGTSMVLATDVEWSRFHGEDAAVFVEFIRSCDLLLFDSHFTPGELGQHHGWGHSSWQQAIEVAERAGVKKLRLIHHAQTHLDADLKTMDEAVSDASAIARLARDGEEYELD